MSNILLHDAVSRVLVRKMPDNSYRQTPNEFLRPRKRTNIPQILRIWRKLCSMF